MSTWLEAFRRLFFSQMAEKKKKKEKRKKKKKIPLKIREYKQNRKKNKWVILLQNYLLAVFFLCVLFFCFFRVLENRKL